MAEVEVEKTMLGFFVIDELAVISTPAGFAAKGCDFRKGRDAVGLAMEKYHRRQMTAQQSQRRVFLRAQLVGKFRKRCTASTCVDQGTEEDQGLRPTIKAINRRQILLLWQGGHQCQQRAASGTADDNALGIDLKCRRVLAQPTDQITRVLDGFKRASAMTRCGPSFRRHRHCAAVGKVKAVGDKLSG